MKLTVQVHPDASVIATWSHMFPSVHNILLEWKCSPGFLFPYVGLENLTALGAAYQRNYLYPYALLRWMKWTETLDNSAQSKISGTLWLTLWTLYSRIAFIIPMALELPIF